MDLNLQKLNLIHWNCRSIMNKLDQLKKFIFNHDLHIDIILLNETWLDSNKNIRIPGYHIIRRDSDRPHGGVAIAISNRYDYNIIDTPSSYDFQNLLISVKLGNTIIEILCVYIPPPPNGKFKLKLLKDSLSNITSSNFFIIGDFNAHHMSWGCRNNDSRGNILNSFIDTQNWVCLNDHSVTTFAPFGQEGNVLDLVFASPLISSSCSFSVYNDLLSSNHFPLILSV